MRWARICFWRGGRGPPWLPLSSVTALYLFCFCSLVNKICHSRSFPARRSSSRWTGEVFFISLAFIAFCHRIYGPLSRTASVRERSKKFVTPENVSTPNLNSHYRSLLFLFFFLPPSSPCVSLSSFFSFFFGFVFEYFSPVSAVVVNGRHLLAAHQTCVRRAGVCATAKKKVSKFVKRPRALIKWRETAIPKREREPTTGRFRNSRGFVGVLHAALVCPWRKAQSR